MYRAAPAYRAEYVLLPSGKKSGDQKLGDESYHANAEQCGSAGNQVKLDGKVSLRVYPIISHSGALPSRGVISGHEKTRR